MEALPYYKLAVKDVAAQEISYPGPQLDPSFGSGMPQRRRVTFSPTSSQTVTLTKFSGGGQQIQFRVPLSRGSCADFRNSFIRCDVAVLAGIWEPAPGTFQRNAGYCVFPSGILGGAIEQLTISHTKQNLFLLNNYNATVLGLSSLMSSDAYSSMGLLDYMGDSYDIEWGAAAAAADTSGAVFTGPTVHPLVCPFSCTDKILPTTLSDGILLFTIRLAPGFTSFIGNTADTGDADSVVSITLSNFALEFDMIQIYDPYLSALEEAARSAGGVRVKCPVFDTQYQAVSASQQSLNIAMSGTRVNQILFWQQKIIDKSAGNLTLLPLNKFLNGVSQYMVYVNGTEQVYPRPQFISALGAADAIAALAEMIHCVGDQYRGIRLNTDAFVADGSEATASGNGPIYCVNLQTLLRNDQGVALGVLIDDGVRIDVIGNTDACVMYVCFIKEEVYLFSPRGQITIEQQ